MGSDHLHNCQPRGVVYGIPLIGVATDLRGRAVRLGGRVVHGDGGLAPVAVQRSHTGLAFGLKNNYHFTIRRYIGHKKGSFSMSSYAVNKTYDHISCVTVSPMV